MFFQESASSSSNHADEEACSSSKDSAEESNCKIEIAECSNESDNEHKDDLSSKLNGEDKNEENIKDPLDISTSQNGTIPQVTVSDESSAKEEPASNDKIETKSEKSNLQNGELKKDNETQKTDISTTEEEIATNKIKGTFIKIAYFQN